MDTARVQRSLRRQGGLITAEQAMTAGMSPRAIRRRVAAGEWVRAAHLVYRAADHPLTPRARIRAAMLSVGEDATLAGRAAAYWWRLDTEMPDRIEVAVAPTRRPRPRPGVTFWRRPVLPSDRVVVDGVQVTARAPTVLAASAELGLDRGAALMDRALQDGGVTVEALRAALLRASGRWGSPRASRLVDLADGAARFEAERVAHALLRDAGIDGWVANLEIHVPGFGRAVGDMVFVGPRVIVEVDGWAYHRGLRAFLLDAARQNALVAAGWTVLRTNWYELRDRPEVFVAVLRSVLGERSPVPERHAQESGRLAT